jgi:hypothetical protein
MPINPIPQPVDVIINPSGEPPKIKDFIINAPLIVQSTNVKNKLDTITKETDNLSTRLSALESSIDSNITNIISNASGSLFFSNTPNIIETSGSLYLSGAIKSSYISSSTGAYITGSVTQGYSGNIASGMNSHAEGRQTRAQGIGSHAEGYGGAGYASGNYSHAEGQATIAYGAGSHAEGYQTNASGDYCHAEGQDTYVTTLGDYSHAEGHFTKVDNRYAHAEGYGTLASNLYAHAEGYLTTGSGQASHAEGISTTASGNHSHAEGSGSIASGGASHAEGQLTLASGIYAHAEGYLTTASAYASHAEGQNTTAGSGGSHAEGFYTSTVGNYSHAQGSGSIAWGIYSFAAGNRTIASGSVDVTQAAFGRFNKRENTTSLFVIGNGTGDSDALRGDIFRTESTGELVLSGGIRHSFLNNVINTTLMNLNYHMWVFDTFQNGGNINVTLPIINDNVVDIGLTVVIKQHDSDGSGRIVTIRPTTGKTILGFNTEFTAGPGMVLTTLGGTKPAYTRRSITLTYTGLNVASGNYRWTVMATSEC